MHSAPAVLRKPVFSVRPIARRRYARADLSHRHSRLERIAGSMVGAIMFALVIAGLIYTVRMMPSAMPARDAAADRFAQHRMARIVIPTDDGRCREYAFSNDSGFIGRERVAACDDDRVRAPKAGSTVGFESFKQAFGRK
jgi:hypothetical protein